MRGFRPTSCQFTLPPRFGIPVEEPWRRGTLKRTHGLFEIVHPQGENQGVDSAQLRHGSLVSLSSRARALTPWFALSLLPRSQLEWVDADASEFRRTSLTKSQPAMRDIKRATPFCLASRIVVSNTRPRFSPLLSLATDAFSFPLAVCRSQPQAIENV